MIGTLGDRWRAAHPARVALPEASAVAPSGSPVGRDAPVPAIPGPAGDERLDLNSADARALDGLPGIGPVLAERIVEHRRAHGPFRTTDELLAVRGIGPRLFARLQPLVRAGVTTPTRASDGPGERLAPDATRLAARALAVRSRANRAIRTALSETRVQFSLQRRRVPSR